MKKIIWIILTTIVIGVGYTQRDLLAEKTHALLYYSPCDTPLTYRIDEIDPRFNISTAQFLADIKTGASLWSNVLGKNLFVYAPQGKIAVSLIYDERQQLNSQINQMDSQLKEQDQQLKPEIADYEKRLTDFNDRVTALNQEIASWNEKGGAPPEEFERMQDLQSSLQSESESLEAESQRLNQSATAFNDQIGQLNQTIDSFQDVLVEKPEEGVYISDKEGKRIHIYFNSSRDEIIHTLAHEFGHALEIDHITNKQAIMYEQTSETTRLTTDDEDALVEVCKEVPITTTAMERIMISLLYWRELFSQQIQKNQ
ncbi:MAG: matrixin family metalloprotease [Patescibacteria group bacterium]|mgnify:CR=1 FL=1